MAHKQLTVCKSLINSKVNETLNNKCTQNNLLSTSVQIITALRINITFKNTFKNKYYSYSVVLNNLSGIQLKTLRININNINNIQRVLDFIFLHQNSCFKACINVMFNSESNKNHRKNQSNLYREL